MGSGAEQLSGGAIQRVMAGEDVDKPVFQILGFKRIAGQNGNDRYRLHISDGVHSHTFAMLATQLNDLIPQGKVENFCVIRAEKMVSNAVSGKRVLIILELTLLTPGSSIGKKLGNPVQWTDNSSTLAPKTNESDKASTSKPKPPTTSSFYGKSPQVKKELSTKTPASTNMDFDPEACIPIRDLTPYNSRCAIRARVTNKPAIRTWSNSKGEGKLFSVDLLDDSGEIKFTCFNQAVDQFYDLLEVNKVYYFARFTVKNARREFSSINHDYELNANNDTQIIPCKAKTSDIPTVTYNFVQISNIESLNRDQVVDVIGVCKSVGELVTITSRAGKEFKKKEIQLIDQTGTQVSLTLWGSQAEEFVDETNPIIAVKGAKVSDFNGKSLSCQHSSLFQVNPDISNAHSLRGWFDNEGCNIEATSLSAKAKPIAGNWKLLAESKSLSPGMDSDKADYFMSKVTITSIKKENAMYKACSTPSCNKKVIDNSDGTFRCEKCNKETTEYKWRAILQVSFTDCSDTVWASCFQEQAEIILGKKAEELGVIYSNDPEGFEELTKQACFMSCIVKFRSKLEVYNGEQRQRVTVVDLNPINYVEYCKKLVAEIKECFN